MWHGYNLSIAELLDISVGFQNSKNFGRELSLQNVQKLDSRQNENT